MSCRYKSQGFYFHRRLVEAATGVFTGSPYGAVDVPPELWGPQGALLKQIYIIFNIYTSPT